GLNMNEYFVPPLDQACRGLGIAKTTQLQANVTPEFTTALHTSGFYGTPDSALSNEDWYWSTFLPKIKEYYHGDLVYTKSTVQQQGKDEQRMWAMYGNEIYDLTDYFHTQDLNDKFPIYNFLNSDLTTLWSDNPGQDIKSLLDDVISGSQS